MVQQQAEEIISNQNRAGADLLEEYTKHAKTAEVRGRPQKSSSIPASILQNSSTFDSLSDSDKEKFAKKMAGADFEQTIKGKKLPETEKIERFIKYFLENKDMYLRSARTKYDNAKMSQKNKSNINAQRKSIDTNKEFLKQVSDNKKRMEELQNSYQKKMSILAKSADQAAYRGQKVNMQRAALASSLMSNVIQQTANISRQISNRYQEISNTNQEISNRMATVANLIANANVEQVALGHAQDKLNHLQNMHAQAVAAAAQTAATTAAGQDQAAATTQAAVSAAEQALALQQQIADQAKAAAEQSAQQAALSREHAQGLAQAQINAAAQQGEATRATVVNTATQTLAGIETAIAGLNPELKNIAAGIAGMNNDLAKRLDELKGSTEEQITAITKALDAAIAELARDKDKIDQIVLEYSQPCPGGFNWFHACLFYEVTTPGVLVCAALTGNHWFNAHPDFKDNRSWNRDGISIKPDWVPTDYQKKIHEFSGLPTIALVQHVTATGKKEYTGSGKYKNGVSFGPVELTSTSGTKGTIIGPKPRDGTNSYENNCSLST